MTDVTIFGKGNMGSAIADVLAQGRRNRHPHRPATTPTPPSPATSSCSPSRTRRSPAIVAAYGDQLAGKIVVDITNPLDFSTFDSLVVPADGSKAAEIAAAAARRPRCSRPSTPTSRRRWPGGQVGDAAADHRAGRR